MPFASILTDLPGDIINYLLTFFQPHHKMGENALKRIFKRLHPRFNPHLTDRKTVFSIDEVIAGCQTPAEALLFLCDKEISPRLSYINMLKVAGFHPELAKQLLPHTSVAEIHYLTAQHADLALQVWSERQTYMKNSAFFPWGELGNNHIGVAKVILAEIQRVLDQRVTTNQLEKHFPIFPTYLAQLGSVHQEIAEFILNNPTLKEKLGVDSSLIQRYLKLSQAAFNDDLPFSQQNLKSFCFKYAELALTHESIAQQLIAIPNALEILSFHLRGVELGKKHLFIAEKIFASAKLSMIQPQVQKIIVEFGVAHAVIAKKIMLLKDFLLRLSGADLAKLAQNHLFVWQAIIDNADLKKKLQPRDYAIAGSKLLAIANAILASASITSQFVVDDWATLIKNKADIALTVWKSLEVSDPLSIDLLPTLFKSHNRVALAIIRDEKWLTLLKKVKTPSKIICPTMSFSVRVQLLLLQSIRLKATKTDLMLIAGKFPKLQKVVLTHPECQQKFVNDKGRYADELKRDYLQGMRVLIEAKKLLDITMKNTAQLGDVPPVLPAAPLLIAGPVAKRAAELRGTADNTPPVEPSAKKRKFEPKR